MANMAFADENIEIIPERRQQSQLIFNQ